MLLGRRAEGEGLLRLLDAARQGVSSARIVQGEPGIGKTTLLEHVATAAAGFDVLRVRSLEAESELAFGGLSDLVRPISGALERIPEPQMAALAGALALGPSTPSNRFGVAAGVLSLLGAAAEARPLLVIVDDAQWLDHPSREALCFAGRRLGTEGIVMLFGTRDDTWVDASGLDTLELHGLAAGDAAALVERSGADVSEGVRRRLVTETRGNPLAILEAIESLSPEQLRGVSPITHPLAVGASLQDTFERQLGQLPRDTREALLIAAASDTGLAGEVMGALTLAGAGPAALEPAERAGVIVLTGRRVEFRHPLVRSAAYHAHDAGARRNAHRALAAAIGEGAGEKAAWHLAAASIGPDETVAAMLETAATSALDRSAYLAAAAAFEAAASLSPHDGDRLRRATGAGRALWLGGDAERASAILADVLDLAKDPTDRADVQQLRGSATLFTHPLLETRALLVSEADRVEPHDGRRAATMLLGAALTCFMSADFEQGGELLRRTVAAGAEGTPTSTVATLVLDTAYHGRVDDDALTRMGPMHDLLDGLHPATEAFLAASFLCQGFAYVERWDLAQTMLEALVRVARSASAPIQLIFPLAALAELQLRRGKVARAYAFATESAELAAAVGQTVLSSFALVTLARVEAMLGREDSCRLHVDAALDCSRRTGAGSIDVYAGAVLGLLELSLGRADHAVEHLTTCARLDEARGVGLPTAVPYAADLIEALIRTGDLDGAARSLAVLGEQAHGTGLHWALAAAARCGGMLASEADYEDEFATALRLWNQEALYERARTQLCLGMRRRRSRRRNDARAALHEALTYFASVGAESWAARVRTELRAAGETSVRTAPGPQRSLTAQELQVALIVAKGATNKEAAASLFLSAKTVEFHLGSVYRKLGIRSRAELALRIEELA